VDPADCRLNDSASERQERLNDWAREAALCLIEGHPRLALVCWDMIARIRRETEITRSDAS
jgi:hypothetical protein